MSRAKTRCRGCGCMRPKTTWGWRFTWKKFPSSRCTINLVPSLLAQLEAYVERRHATPISTLSRRPADGLNDDDACYLLDNFFMANPDSMIRPHPRYHELFMMRSAWNSSAKQALAPVPASRPARPSGLVEPGLGPPPALREGPRAGRVQGQGPALHRGREALASWTSSASCWREVIPLHRELADAGPDRADHDALTTTRSCRCLLDKTSGARGDARRVAAGLSRRLPRRRRRCTSAAPIESHVRHFGERPRGMWPQRGLGLPGDDPAPGRARHRVDRDRRGDPGLLDRTARSAATAGATSAIPSCSIEPGRSARPGTSWRSSSATIRCRTRSGSTISGARARSRPADFLGKLHAIGDACRHNPATLVPVILDGENCWEYYPDGGVSFLRSLYQGVVRDPRIRPVKVGEFLREHPPADTLAPAVRRKLDQPQFRHLDRPSRGQPRLGRSARRPRVPRRGRASRPARSRPLWRGPGTRSTSPRAPTGSGGTATTTPAPSTRLFDHLFRKHLRNVYTLLGCDPPGSLFTPISRRRPTGRSTTSRSAF